MQRNGPTLKELPLLVKCRVLTTALLTKHSYSIGPYHCVDQLSIVIRRHSYIMTHSKGNNLILVALLAISQAIPSSSLFTSYANAQEEERDDYVAPENAEVARLEAIVVQSVRAVESKRKAYEAVAKERGVVRHYRMPQGVPIPAPTPVPNEFIEDVQKEIEAELARVQAEPTAPPKKLMSLRSCGVTSTEKTPRKSLVKHTPKKAEKGTPKDDTENILYDLLVLREKDAPSDSGIIFGTETRVVAYPENGDVSVLLEMLEPFKIECLPYRLRVTRSFYYRHKGEDALKNYDEKADGKGKLHELMKGKVQ